jgi:Protein of unknown function (DUF2752)
LSSGSFFGIDFMACISFLRVDSAVHEFIVTSRRVGTHEASMCEVEGLPIYTRLSPVAPMARSGRAWAALIAAGCVALLLTAAWLTPSPSGHGTHTQLGLTACAFLERTGIPCPGCGMTTAFAHTVRGHFLTALFTQPMGFVLAVLAAVVAWAAGYEAVTGRPIHRLPRQIGLNLTTVTIMAVVLTILAWVWKIVWVVQLHAG